MQSPLSVQHRQRSRSSRAEAVSFLDNVHQFDSKRFGITSDPIL
jgi:hypothetical protein